VFNSSAVLSDETELVLILATQKKNSFIKKDRNDFYIKSWWATNPNLRHHQHNKIIIIIIIIRVLLL
jgi:hypothetical protein